MESQDVCLTEVAYPARERTWPGDRSAVADDGSFLRGLIEGMRCGILAVDRELRLVMVNAPGRQILGLADAPAPGAPVAQMLDAHPELLRLLGEAFRMSSLPNRAELDIRTGEGHPKTIGFTLSMIAGHDGPTGAAIFFKDLTQIEHKEEQERLKDRLAALGQMAASLAHEIRNPLASIDVSCALLGRKLGADAEARELLSKIAAEIQRLNQTITSSLEFVKPVAPTMACSDLAAVLREAIDIAQERKARPGVTISLKVNDALPSFLMDRQQMRQVFENLVLNAIEAVGASGEVSVEAESIPTPTSTSIPYRPGVGGQTDPWGEFDRFAVIRVSDNGSGIPECDRDRIFFPFYTTKKQGSGVGLPMVKKIVNSHRGLIDVGHAPQGGALLTVRLPMVLQSAED